MSDGKGVILIEACNRVLNKETLIMQTHYRYYLLHNPASAQDAMLMACLQTVAVQAGVELHSVPVSTRKDIRRTQEFLLQHLKSVQMPCLVRHVYPTDTCEPLVNDILQRWILVLCEQHLPTAQIQMTLADVVGPYLTTILAFLKSTRLDEPTADGACVEMHTGKQQQQIPYTQQQQSSKQPNINKQLPKRLAGTDVQVPDHALSEAVPRSDGDDEAILHTEGSEIQQRDPGTRHINVNDVLQSVKNR